MIDQADLLTRFSTDLAARTAALQGAVVAIRLPRERHLSATLWQPDVVIASEQSLPRRDEFELVLPGGSAGTAKLAGRDPGTNIAVLSRAVPPDRPTGPNLLINLALAVLLGSVLGFGTAFVLEELDRRILIPEDLSEDLHEAVLARL